MNLRQPKPGYDPQDEQHRNNEIERADRQNHKKNRDVEIGNGRLILKDTVTGTRYNVTIVSGTLTLTSL